MTPKTTTGSLHPHVTKARRRAAIHFCSYSYYFGGTLSALRKISEVYGIDVRHAEAAIHKVRRQMAAQYLKKREKGLPQL